jgi:hypothetical protein
MENKKTENPYAFPLSLVEDSNYACDGMTLRDYFAAKIILGMFSESIIKVSDAVVRESGKTRSQWFAEQAYSFADAMLIEREL